MTKKYVNFHTVGEWNHICLIKQHHVYVPFQQILHICLLRLQNPLNISLNALKGIFAPICPRVKWRNMPMQGGSNDVNWPLNWICDSIKIRKVKINLKFVFDSYLELGSGWSVVCLMSCRKSSLTRQSFFIALSKTVWMRNTWSSSSCWTFGLFSISWMKNERKTKELVQFGCREIYVNEFVC